MLNIALKEWAIVCDLLLEGQLALLLRKGGIHEAGGPGVFELEHRRFVLFPSWAHQKPEAIKPKYRDRVQLIDEPAEITFKGFAEATHIWRVPSRETFNQLDNLHCWTSAHLDMRFNYKPERPLYLLAVRACRLAQPKTIPYHSAFAGCVSWAPLDDRQAVDESAASPVLTDNVYKKIVAHVRAVLETT